jgi:ELWxxDGT repeat protein
VLGVDISGADLVFVSDDYDNAPLAVTNTLWLYSGTGPFFITSQLATLNQYIADPHIVGNSCMFEVSSNYAVTTTFSTNYYDVQMLMRVSLAGGGIEQVDYVSGPDNYQLPPIFDGLTVVNGYLYYSWIERDVLDTTHYGPFEAVGDSGSPVQIEPNGTGFEPIIGTNGSLSYYATYNSFTRDTRISSTDGASAGVQVLDFTLSGLVPYDFVQAGNHFFFLTGGPLGVTDLTSAGTYLVPNSTPGSNNVQELLGTLGTGVFYRYDDGQNGSELYYSDGTTNGTYLVKDIAPGNDSPAPQDGVASGGQYFFTLNTTGLGVQLWRSDGTPAGTGLVKSIGPGTNGAAASQLTAWNGQVFFAASDGTNGTELWRSDGTAAGTFMVKDIRPGPAGSNPSQLAPAGSQLFFVADDGTHGAELWVTDGTASGTVLVQDIVPGIGSSNIRALAATGGEVHFLAGPTNTSGQLWFSTGAGNTQFLHDFGNLDDSRIPRFFRAFGSKVYFSILAGPFTPTVLWSTDDTPAGTVSIANIGDDVAAAGGVLFATVAASSTATNSLWTSDGTAGGTVLLTNIPATQLTSLGSNLYFAVSPDLWSSDGTTNGTVPVTQFSLPDATDPAPANLTPFQGALVFTARTPLLGRELWCTAPGQPTAMIEDLSPLSGDDNLRLISPATNQVFYIARPSGQPYWQLRTLQLQSSPQEGPFGGTPWPVPGLIQAVNFDVGGEGVAYHDTTTDNEGGQYRPTEGVDIEVCNDTNGGFCVFQTRPGEWLNYTIQAAATGMYQLDVRVFSPVVNSGYFRFEVDGAMIVEYLLNGVAGAWSTESSIVGLSAGQHILRLYFEQASTAGDVGVFNWFNFTLLATNQPPVVTIQSPPYGAVLPTGSNVVLSAIVSDNTTAYGPVAEFFMDGQSIGVLSGPYRLNWTATPGPHVLRVTATDSFGASSSSAGRLFFVSDPLFTTGAAWRCSVFGTNAGTAWRLPTFDDSGWRSLSTPMGFGYAGVHLIPSNINNTPIRTFYFRRNLLTDLTGMNYASITLKRNDGAVVYVNGQELARPNLPLPPTNITWLTYALTNVAHNFLLNEPAPDYLPVPLSWLNPGSNLFAVEIHQAPTVPRGDILDLYFDLSLAAFSYNPNPVLQISTDGTNAIVQWPDYLPDWQLEQAPDLAAWSAVTNTPTLENSLSTVRLPLQTDMFFRLHQVPPP